MKKSIIVFFIILVFAISFAGCNMISVNEVRDGEQIVATVNGEPIYKKVILKNADTYLDQYGYTEDMSNYDIYYNSIMEQLLEQEILNVLAAQKCEEFGVEPITAEQQGELETYRSILYDNAYAVAKNNYPEEDYKDAEEREELIKQYAENTLTSAGYYDGTSEDTYRQMYIIENLQNYLVNSYDPSDDEVKAYYDQQVKDQQEIFDSSMMQFDSIEVNDVLVYVPDGIRYVRNLLVALPDDIRTEITSLRNAGSSEEADALREQELAKIKDRADEAYEAALVDFDSALSEYGEDPGMEDEVKSKEGYRLHSGIYDFDTIFKETGMALSDIGDISEPTASDYGYYIIEYTSEMEPGIIAYEEVKDDLYEYMIQKKLNETYNVNLGIWLDEAKIVRYTNKIEYRG